MIDNMNFYRFMHKQILIVIGLFISTGAGYLYMGWIYASLLPEILWFTLLLVISYWGYRLHRVYADNDLNMVEKEKWLHELRYFLFIYFSIWTIMFVMYISRSTIELHYMAVATQLGVTVVSATILVSQRKLATLTLVSLMIPLMIYFILLGEFYSYLLAFFTVVLSGVLLYASNNTFNYLVKSQYQAYHDYLTSLGNRRYFIELIEDVIKAKSNHEKYLYLLLIDLDHFKSINDTLGHDIGDDLLREVATRMSLLGKETKNNVARLGGDEFCVLSGSFETKQECMDNAMKFAEKLLETIKESYVIDEHHLYISASIGVSLINNLKMKANTFIKEADIAMYEAKSLGRDGIILFNDDLSMRVERNLEIEQFLHFALKNDEITLKYQPQFNTQEEVIGCEVLVRWHNEKLGNVGPNEFIPISEQTGLILELGYFILEESFKTMQEWDRNGIIIDQMSINISMRQLIHHNFIHDVQKLCKAYLNPELCKKIVFEMTETSVAEDIQALVKNINILKDDGIRFSIDDFGTGYSSLSYLRQIPIDELKIDRSFIMELDNSEDGRIMVNTIINIAKNLKLMIVAEGVETEFQKGFLINNGCDILQGYYYAKALDKAEFVSLRQKIK